MKFIKDINLACPDSYCQPFVTFDVDWAHDEIIADVLELVDKFNVRTTWMLTHKTEVLLDYAQPNMLELGIHPNFNYLLSGDFRLGRSASEVVSRLLDFVPDAKTVRSHSLCQSSRLSKIFFDFGIKFESNDYIPACEVDEVYPWALELGIVKVPYFFSDELSCIRNPEPTEYLIARNGIKVFNFHPIHVFLNTESLERYEQTRPLHHMPKELINYRYEGYGARSRLIELLESFQKL